MKRDRASIRVLQVIPAYWPAVRYGGPIVSVRELSKAVASHGVSVDVATTNADGPTTTRVPLEEWVSDGDIRIRYFQRHSRSSYGFSAGLYRFLHGEAGSYDLVHITGTFSFPSLIAGRAARSAGIPYLVSPRGSLQRWSLSQKRWKKAPYWYLLEQHHLQRAAAIHATSDPERREVLGVLPEAKIIVVPNGTAWVDAPATERKRQRILFLGRLHRGKGLEILIPALSLLEQTHPGMETIIAGPDDSGEWTRIQALLDASKPRPRVHYIGSVTGAAKYEMFASAAVFVLPSHSENFGQAVLEALMCGTPVVVSKNTPWEAVARAGAGFWTDNDPRSVADALRAVLTAGDGGIGYQRAARALAGKFSWDAIGASMAEHYRGIVRRTAAIGPRRLL